METSLIKTQLAVVDTETNNYPTYREEDGSPDFTRVLAIDVGIILLDGIEDPEPVTHEFSFQLNDLDFHSHSDPEAFQVNGYEHELRSGLPVVNSFEAREVWLKITELLRGRTIVASNTAFDDGVLKNALISHEICKPTGKPGEHWEPWSKRMVDVRALSHLLMWWYGTKNASVQTSYDYITNYGLPPLKGHRALNDAWKALRVLKFVYKEW